MDRERPRAPRGKSQGSASSEDQGVIAGRSRRRKRRPGRVLLPVTVFALLLVGVVWGGIKVMTPQQVNNDGVLASINGLGNSKSAAGVTEEYNTLTAMMSASQVLTVDAVATHTNPDQIMAANSMSSSSMSASETGTTVTTVATPNNVADNQAIAKELMPNYGFSVSAQWACLDDVWTRESSWDKYAENTSSGAYGIPQSLPGDKMATIASDWQTDATTQIKWGLGYIQSRYGTPCAAWNHELADGFY